MLQNGNQLIYYLQQHYKGNLITCSSHTSRKQSSCDLNQRFWSHAVKSVALYIAKKPPKLNTKWFCIPQQRRLLGKQLLVYVCGYICINDLLFFLDIRCHTKAGPQRECLVSPSDTQGSKWGTHSPPVARAPHSLGFPAGMSVCIPL